MKTTKKSSTLLKAHFLKLKKGNPRFSVRSLSQKLGVSHSFLVNILNGKNLLPLARLNDLCKNLKIDDEDRTQIRNLILLEKNGFDIEGIKKQMDPPTKQSELLPESHLVILHEWWNLALLELLSCHPAKGLDRAGILSRIDLTPKELETSLVLMKNFGLIEETKAQRFRKTNEDLKIPTRGPNSSTRLFYKRALQLAQSELLHTSENDFNKRLISTISCAVNPLQIPLAKQRLVEALREIRDILTVGECTDVYFLQAQLFSVLKKDLPLAEE